MDNRNQLSQRELQMLQRGEDPYAGDTSFDKFVSQSQIHIPNSLNNTDDLYDYWINSEDAVGDEGLQDELMNAIAERAKVLSTIRSKQIPGGGGDLAYEQRDINALKKAGYDPNDMISRYLLEADLSNTNYDDPMNKVYDILER